MNPARWSIGALLLLGVLAVALPPGLAFAQGENGAEIIPPAPTTADLVRIHYEGGLPDTCWHYQGFSVEQEPGAIILTVDLFHMEGVQCLQVVLPFVVDAPVGRLDAGLYELFVVEGDRAWSQEFTVHRARGSGFLPGDPNRDGSVDLSDAVFILLYLFLGGPAPSCEAEANVNGDGTLDLSDAVFLLEYLFAGGSMPRPLAECHKDEHCIFKDWPIFCVGNWECDCGVCSAVCDDAACGDGICDLEAGESVTSCSGDCEKRPCRPVCSAVGTRSEGWYDSCTGKLLDYAFCAPCVPVCRHCGSKSEGWYDSCTDELIEWADCDCAE